MPRKNFYSLPVEQCRRKDAYTRLTDQGYVLETCPEHPRANATNQGRFYQHRLVMEEYLGRLLEPDEIVHHCDGIRRHNDLDNLDLALTGKHVQEHMKSRHKDKPLNDPYYINWVRQAAHDPNIGKKDLVREFPYSLSTVNRILEKYKIRWVSVHELHLDEKHVEKVLHEYSRKDAPKILGCSVQWLWNNYPELMRKTANRKLKSYSCRNPK